MHRAIGLIVLGGASLELLACESFELRMRPDAGGPTQEDGAAGPLPPPVQGIAPAGAVLGELRNMFGGDCQTWAMLDGEGKVSELAFTLPMATVNGIPSTTKVDVIFYIELPDVVKEQTLFKSLDYTYLPAGHVPAGVYDTPHWEWHLSKFTKDERASVDCSDPTMPAADAIPQNWIVFPECLAGTGHHGYDLAAPEYNRERFTKGNYISYYHGFLGGLEPQATRDLLSARADIELNDAPKMQKVGTKGLYPSKAKMRYDAASATYVITYSGWSMVE